jgi:hypothetical protein
MAGDLRRRMGALVFIAGLSGAGLRASPTTIYVDGGIGSASCTAYNPATRLCTGGTDTAYRTIQAAAAATAPGVTVSIRAGAYPEPLLPPVSGTPEQPITYARYGSETVTVTGSSFDPAVDLSNRSYLVVDGLTVTDVVAWLRAQNSHHLVIRNCVFTRATAAGSRAGLKFVQATYNRIANNTIDDGNDNLSLIDSNYNVVEGNRMTRGRHALWNILCGNYNIVRNNSFNNLEQKIGQITDCEGAPSDAPLKYNATKYNLVDGNTFEYVPSSGGAAPYSGIQYSAQHGIIRRNRFYNTVGPAIQMTLYSDEARYLTDTRIYHNVFDGTSFGGVQIQASSYTFSGHVFKNNVFSNSVFVASDTRWSWYTNELAGKPVQIMAERLDGFVFERNDILGTAPNQTYAVTYGDRTETANPAQHPLTWWQQNYPKLFLNNVEALPMYVDRAVHDYRLSAGSPLIDAGTFLTKTASAGSGTTIAVQDASYFVDGFGIPGETGDLIQLHGQTETSRVVRVDYATNTITVDRALTWTAGQGLALSYSGAAPDIGAFETGTGSSQPPSAPANVRIR